MYHISTLKEAMSVSPHIVPNLSSIVNWYEKVKGKAFLEPGGFWEVKASRFHDIGT
jgi:hypothetical protein